MVAKEMRRVGKERRGKAVGALSMSLGYFLCQGIRLD